MSRISFTAFQINLFQEPSSSPTIFVSMIPTIPSSQLTFNVFAQVNNVREPSSPRTIFASMISSIPSFQLLFMWFVLIFNNVRESSSLRTIFTSMFPTLLGFLQLLTSGRDPSPYELHPWISMASLLFLLAYYSTFIGERLFPAYASQFGFAMLLFGSFYVGTLVSLLLPPIPWTWWSIMSMILLVCGWLLLVIKFYNIVHGLGLARRSRNSQPLLPY